MHCPEDGEQQGRTREVGRHIQLTGWREHGEEGRVLTRETGNGGSDADLQHQKHQKHQKHRRNLFPDEVEFSNLLEA